MKKISVGLVAMMGILLAFVFHLKNAEQSAETINPSAVAVGQLASRDHILTIFTEGDRNLYSVASSSGKVLAEMLDETALKSEFPTLHQQIKTGIAGDTFIWAGMDLPNTNVKSTIIENEASPLFERALPLRSVSE